jgi:endonuclease/exonuclease/phosphatase family metal-dependent hydrolase
MSAIAMDSGAVRIMTWNIHGGVGPDRRCDLQRIVDLARRQEPDILALQEVDSRRRGAGTQDAFRFLTGALGSHSAESKLIAAPDGEYGHVVISRWPLSGTVFHDISISGREPRAAIETCVATPAGPLHVVAAHLGLSIHERRWQARLLASVARRGPARTVLLGDFNDWVWKSSVQGILAELLPVRTHHKTWPSCRPVFALDRIYCRPAATLGRNWTDPLARRASDHLPIIADLHLASSPEARAPSTCPPTP